MTTRKQQRPDDVRVCVNIPIATGQRNETTPLQTLENPDAQNYVPAQLGRRRRRRQERKSVSTRYANTRTVRETKHNFEKKDKDAEVKRF